MQPCCCEIQVTAMALICVSIELVSDPEIWDWITNAFDKFEVVDRNNATQTLLCRVQHDEIPTDDILITPEFHLLPGLDNPIVIDWGLPDQP